MTNGSSKALGSVTLPELIAVPSDFSRIVKARDRIPSISESIKNDIIILTKFAHGYKEGGFYEFNGETWKEIDKDIPNVYTSGVGSINLSENGDSTYGNISYRDLSVSSDWSYYFDRSEVVLANVTEGVINYECPIYQFGLYGYHSVKVTLPKCLSSYLDEKLVFMVKTLFRNGTFLYSTLTKIEE